MILSFTRNNVYFFIIGLSLFLYSYLSIYWGPSTDELYQQPYGEKSFDFYRTLGQDDTVITYKLEPLLTNYGAFLDTIPEAIKTFVPIDLFLLRHFIIALFSALYIVFGSLIAYKISGIRAGYIALLLLIFCPRLFGEGLNNPKDIPFAAGYLGGLFILIHLFDNIYQIKRRDIMIAAIIIGMAISIRVGGILLIGYAGLFLILKYLVDNEFKNNLNTNKNWRNLFFKQILIILGFAYLIGIVFWPSALVAPFTKPFDAFQTFSKFPVTIKTLFDGTWIMSTELPSTYILKYIFISIPEITLIGLFGLIFVIKNFTNTQKFYISLLFFATIFPIFFIIYKKSAMYNGWRHSYFAFSSSIVLAALFWDKLFCLFSKSKLKFVFATIFILLLLLPACFMLKNFPHFYVYFNRISGGIEKNYANYEMDYYGHSVNEATFWIQKNHPEWLQDSNIKLVSNVPYNMQKIMDRWHFKNYPGYVRYRERFDSDWDIGVFSPAFVDPEIMKNGYFKSKDVIHTINIDDKPIGIILKRQDKNDFYGKRALDSQQYPKAIEFLNKALQYDPNNEIAWTNLGFAQLNTNQPNEAVQSLSNALKISPESMMAKNYLAYAYLQSGNLPYAQSVLMNLIEENPKMPDPYRLLAQIYQQQGNGAMAQQYMNIYQQITGQMGGQ